ncbi:MAG: L-threonylcarbamoyladenylate synthase [Thermoplasmataceae archaeon]
MHTIVLKVDQVNPDPEIVNQAAGIIRDGGTVVFPTETVYGLGANALSESASRKIFSVKGRPVDNPLIVHICNLSQLDLLCEEIPAKVRKAMEFIWPGPVTLILKRRVTVPDTVTAGLLTVAVRMPANSLALALIEKSGVPIAAPSANIATRPSIVDSSDAISELSGLVDMILDAGRTYFGIESTIVNMTVDPPEMLRPGVLSLEDLEPFIGKVVYDPKAMEIHEDTKPLSPGMKYTHYSPRKPLILVIDTKTFRKIPEMYGDITLIGTDQALEGLPGKNLRLGDESRPYEVAYNLFKAFRLLDDTDSRCGVIHVLEERGIGIAMMNRIRKASRFIVSDENELKNVLCKLH